MRKSLYLIVSIIVMFSTLPQALAQPMPPHGWQEGPRKEMRSPKEIAKAKTERMQHEVGLDDKQFKKILYCNTFGVANGFMC